MNAPAAEAPAGLSARPMPSSPDAERSALGSVLIAPELFGSALGRLGADDFFLPAHREIFCAYEALARREQPLDIITVADELKVRGTLPRLEGGESYLITLTASVPTIENVEHYVEIIREKAALRRLIAQCAETMSRCYGELGDGVAGALDDHASAVAKIAIGRATARAHTLAALAPGILERVEERCRNTGAGRIEGVTFGAKPLDALIGGLKESEQLVLAGEVGSGKTALAMQAALENARHKDGASLVFSLEMTAEQLGERLLAHTGEVNSHAIRRGELDPQAFRRLFDATRRASSEAWGARLELDGEARSMREVSARARQWRAKNPGARGLIVLDFLQLMELGGAKGETRAAAVGAAAYAFKRLLKELKVAGILLSQLNREGKKGFRGRDGVVVKSPPTKLDLKESSGIEESADYIVLLWNPEGTEDGEIDAILDKARGGICRTVKLHWTGRYYRFRAPDNTAWGAS